MSSIYEIADLERQRGGGGHRFTLRVPEMVIGSGELVVVHGESGCGKSTLLDLLGMVLRPTSSKLFGFHPRNAGRIDISAATPEPVLTAIRRREIGYILQTGGLLPFLTVQRNIELPRRINGLPVTGEEAVAITERLGIRSQLLKLPAELSGGQRQRAAIARALAHAPPVILADEPTAAVDQLTASEILSHLEKLIRELAVTLILVTHNVSPVRELADRFFTFRVSRGAEGVISTCHEAAKPALA